MLVMTLTSAQKLDKAVQVLNLCIKRKVLLATPPIAELLQACYKFGKFDTVFKIFALYAARRAQLSLPFGEYSVQKHAKT
ncbi:hypothetical protein PInf_010066 [Phytophthora infestans]|nr:hypothetical protein PInf_010066 [Phytophthora infestans]